MGRYDDIIGLERPLSSHVRMPRADRAKQFMPFASLRGFDDEIREREEVLEERRTPSEDEDAVKNARVNELARVISSHPAVRVLLFVPSRAGSGEGKTVWVTGTASGYDPAERTVRLSGRKISLDDVYRLEILRGEKNGQEE
ncbi:MAG: hypothetical protein IKI84_07875 [Clostridia bacterium]|nr:hypothetical protein [Clostridia bacterium]